MNASLAHARCLNHPLREAAGRCTACGQDFCRECIGEHAHKLLCARCLSRAATKTADRSRWTALAPWWQIPCALLLLWFAFYTGGRLLLAIPSSYHETTLAPIAEPEQR